MLLANPERNRAVHCIAVNGGADLIVLVAVFRGDADERSPDWAWHWQLATLTGRFGRERVPLLLDAPALVGHAIRVLDSHIPVPGDHCRGRRGIGIRRVAFAAVAATALDIRIVRIRWHEMLLRRRLADALVHHGVGARVTNAAWADRPWLAERDWIFGHDIVGQHVAVSRPPLDDVQLVAVNRRVHVPAGRTTTAYPRLFGETDGIDDQRVAFPAAGRMTPEARLEFLLFWGRGA